MHWRATVAYRIDIDPFNKLAEMAGGARRKSRNKLYMRVVMNRLAMMLLRLVSARFCDSRQ